MFTERTICTIRCAMDYLAKMPADGASGMLSGQTEKPHHYTYLKEFRTQQCPDFLQHKCTRHRPYTCFHWHFVNQKRRRPVKRRDGTFNYSADIYCPKYDETTGICPDGDDCTLLHRVAGDAERRYHLRYFKTCSCVHETDSRGQCTKNGAHCAFAHGAEDLRQPVFEAGEENSEDVTGAVGGVSNIAELSLSLEKDILCNEDPCWNDMRYVLIHYKTDVCRRPHRLCRQGYACPSYHNLRDKRRSPQALKYRSTPCPSVKHGDEWGDPSQCDAGDNCTYCHTRTEQQFHPEIYKSTKCNDMVQTGYCPRGPFCAFAHVEHEMSAQWDIPGTVESSLAAFVQNVLPRQTATDSSSTGNKSDTGCQLTPELKLPMARNPANSGILTKAEQLTEQNICDIFKDGSNTVNSSWLEPIGHGRTNSISSDSPLMGYHKAPGCERENAQNWVRRRASTMDPSGIDVFAAELAMSRHFVPPLLHSYSVGSPSGGNTGSSPLTPLSVNMSPRGLTYSSEDTVESVIGNALDEDFGRLNLASLDNELTRGDNDTDCNSLCSPLSASFSAAAASSYFGSMSGPMAIPSSGGAGRPGQYGGTGSVPSSCGSLPAGYGVAGSLPTGSATSGGSVPGSSTSSFSPLSTSFNAGLSQVYGALFDKPEGLANELTAGFHSSPSTSGATGASTGPAGLGSGSLVPAGGSPASVGPGGLSVGGAAIGGVSNNVGVFNIREVQRLRDELIASNLRLTRWKDSITQARNACEAWRKEAEEWSRKAKKAEEERQFALRQRDEAVVVATRLRQELEALRGSPYLCSLQRTNELELLPMSRLQQLHTQLRHDLETLEKAMTNSSSSSAAAAASCGGVNTTGSFSSGAASTAGAGASCLPSAVGSSSGAQCVICKERRNSVRALACQHGAVCTNCARLTTQCPSCWASVTPSSLPSPSSLMSS